MVALFIAAATILPACSSGSGGDNGDPNPRSEVTASGLNFTYPFNGQSDVLLDTAMVVNFEREVSGSIEDAFELRVNNQPVEPGLEATKDADSPNIIRLQPAQARKLLPNTRYNVVATRSLSDGTTSFDNGETLFSFETRPLEGRPAADNFRVNTVTPGEVNFATREQSVFTQFNAIRVIFNEPVDSSTVNNQSFTVTGPDGQVTDAKLTALGRYIVFDPNEDLAPGEYTISWTDAITSVFGKQLVPGSESRTVLDIGDQSTDQILVIEDETTSPTGEVSDINNILDGLPINNVNIQSQLIGSNDQPVIAPADDSSTIRNRVATTLATPGQPGFRDVFPAVIRAGQKFQLAGLTLELGGEIATPIAPSGPIDVNFINDVSVYLMGNDYRNVETPTAVELRFDLGIGTLITETFNPNGDARPFVIQQLANGVFNQSVLNIQAAGLAIPRDNGDLEISTLGTFPINVNRTDNATVNFQLTLVLPAAPADGEGGSGTTDSIAPILTAQSPSACLYVFGSPLYDNVYQARGAAPTALPEPLCQQILGTEATNVPGGRTPPFINSFPIESSPAITFSSPIDPSTVNAQSVQLSGDGVVFSDDDVNYRVEGFSIVIDPEVLLTPDTDYTIALSTTIKDLEGNALTGDNLAGPGLTIDFTTEPQVDEDPAPALLGALTPGIPCALNNNGDFRTGGDNVGNCMGSSEENAPFDYPVFNSPVDVPVDGVFSKFVTTDSLVLADGCLTGGSGSPNTRPGASIALQTMDGSGQCIGTPDAELAFANIGDELTRSFTIRPVEALEVDTRYWIVVCGEGGTDCVNNAGSIVDADGLALNTNPLMSGSGSTPTGAGAAGGPDILMPFDTVAATSDYFTNQFTLPEADTNGNGQLDEGEREQPGNRALVNLSLLGQPLDNSERPDGAFASYLALARPISIRESTTECSDVDAVTFDPAEEGGMGESAVGGTPDQCVPVSLLPGGINSLTGIAIGLGDALPALQGTVLNPLTEAVEDGTALGDIPVLGSLLGGVFDTTDALLGTVTGAIGDLLNLGPEPINTGRILLRFPNDPDAQDAAVGPAQRGFIVERCEGTFPNGQVYDFEPCFTASLNLVANAPDGQGVTLEQQEFTANIIGPVTFEQNGRLVISLRNTNTIALRASALGVLPATATIEPGNLNFQLVGNATHGGRAFPNR